jgi:hypothetical protein
MKPFSRKKSNVGFFAKRRLKKAMSSKNAINVKYRAPSHWEQLKRVLRGKPAHPNDEQRKK